MCVNSSKPRIVLVHGAAHGAWCWDRIVPRLRARGFDVAAFDLPGLGADLTPARDVTLALYVTSVLAAVRASPQAVVLVGHSMGGGPVSAAAELASEQIRKIIYLAATLPVHGEGLGKALQLSQQFPGPSASSALRPSQTDDALDFAPELAAAAFYNQCDAATAQAAVARLRPQATRPLQGEPIALTAARYGKIPKTYVVCTADQALPPALQRWFCARVPQLKTIEKSWDHSPFLSDPQGLTDLLAAESVGD
jgi:pimeloyl-ACP methyl ester carboxylesterase